MRKDLDSFIMNQTFVDNKTIKDMCNCYKLNGFMVGALVAFAIGKIAKSIKKDDDKKYHQSNYTER